MSITFIGPAGSCEVPWIRYALLCDNVQHHFKRQDFSSTFCELYRGSDAVGQASVRASALKLRHEVARVQGLCLLSAEKLAISSHTKSVLFMEAAVAQTTEIVGPGLSLPWLQADPRTLGDVFGDLVTMLLEITAGATEEDSVEIIDG